MKFKSATDYWRRVREVERALPALVWLMPLRECYIVGRDDEPTPSPIVCARSTAAEHLAAERYRRATDAEVKAHLEREERARLAFPGLTERPTSEAASSR